MNDWQKFLEHIRKAYRAGVSPDNGSMYNESKDPEESHIEWEIAIESFLRLVLASAPEARKAARLVQFVQGHPRIGWWYA